ncbi:hypothetical protein SDC9_175513 [bioreactor metagenome]|uniref:Uncharacterized protein n=1 Tax=bioreactor metagenome TaxID=1076179 RepID=A0A645GVL7_9ZZZZ
MRRQKDNALAGGARRFDMLPADDLGNQRHRLFQRPHPDARQFDHLLAGFGGNGTADGGIDTSLSQVVLHVAAIGRRQPVNQPAKHPAKGMQHAQREQGKKTKEKNHEAPGVESP